MQRMRRWTLRVLLGLAVGLLLLAITFPYWARVVSVPQTRTVYTTIKQLHLLYRGIEGYRKLHGHRPSSLSLVFGSLPKAIEQEPSYLWENYGFDYRPHAKGREPLISRCAMGSRPTLAWVTSDGHIFLGRVKPWLKVPARDE